MLANLAFRTTDTYLGVDYFADVDAEFSDADDNPYAPVPVRPRKRPPTRSDRIALPEPE